MYKKAMSDMYFHFTTQDGALCLYVSPNDDTDTGVILKLEPVLKEFCQSDELDSPIPNYTKELIDGFYKNRDNK